jgi:hypothetical protein
MTFFKRVRSLPVQTMQLATAALLLAVQSAAPVRAADSNDVIGAVPPSWTAYAAQVAHRLQEELGDTNDPAATRLHQFLDAQATSTPDAASPTPRVRLWFSRRGQISRVEFSSLGDPQADQDLRHVLRSHAIGAPPPHDMRQPLILRLRLTNPPNPAD